MKNEKNEYITDVTGLTLTFTANSPTAGTANTIADGAAISDAETAQTLLNITTILNALIAKVNS